MKMILDAIKETLLSFSPNRSFYESMMRYDFKIGAPKQNLMQLCFSPLAAWTLLLLLAAIYLDPTKYLWSLQRSFGDESPVTLFLLIGKFSSMLILFGIFFLLEWILRKEYLLVGIVFYFLAKSDLHIHLATAAILGIYLARACHLWWFHVDLESASRKIWHTMTNLLLIAWLIVAVGSLFLLDYMQANQFFAGSMTTNRFEFLTLVVIAIYAASILLLSVWGHFYVRKKMEPSFLPVHYSTSKWILRFKMSAYLRKQLQEKIQAVLPEHQKSAAQFKEMKDQSPGLGLGALLTTLNSETSYLQEASSRLTIE